MTMALSITSWNIRGISSACKRTKVLNHLHKLKSDICLIQETHLTEAESQKLKAGWIGQTYQSTYNSNKRGTYILLSKNTPYSRNTTLSDPEGHYIIMNGKIDKDNITIANTVSKAPTLTPLLSFTPSSQYYPTHYSNSLRILGGDFNIVLNPEACSALTE